jgi:hypothetical protein
MFKNYNLFFGIVGFEPTNKLSCGWMMEPQLSFNLGFTRVAYFVGSHLIQLWEVLAY